MPFNYNRDTYAQILEKAKATLAEDTEAKIGVKDPLLDAHDRLKADAHELAKRFHANLEAFGTSTIANIDGLGRKIEALRPDRDDFAAKIAEYRADLDAAAEWYGIVLPSSRPAAQPAPPTGSIFDEIKAAPDILREVKPYELLNYNLANALLNPEGRTRFYQRERRMTLAMTSLAATAWLNRDGHDVAGSTAATTSTSTGGEVSELRSLINEFVRGGASAQGSLARMLREMGVTTLEALVRLANADAPTGVSPGANLRRKLAEKHPDREAKLPPVEVLEKLVQAATDKLNS